MKRLQQQLNAIRKSLSTLTVQVERALKQVDKLQGVKPKPIKKVPPKVKKRSTVATRRAAKGTIVDNVFAVIKASRKGASLDKLRKKTGLEARQLSNALYKLTKSNRIMAVSRGVYAKK